MKKFKRILAVVLALLMLASVLVACKKDAEEEQSGDDTSVSTESGTEYETNEWGERVYMHNIPEGTDYGGKEIIVYVSSTDCYQREWFTEPRTDSIDNEVFKRNRTVQDQLNVKMTFKTYSNTTAMNTDITNAGNMGGDGLDIINIARNDAGNTNNLPLYKNLRSDEFTYLNLDNGYWSQYFNSAFTVGGKQIYLVGDVNLSLWDRAVVTFFNKTLLKDNYSHFGMTEEDLYNTVIDGKWTYEKFYNLIKDFHVEGDDIEGTSAGDTVGLCSIWVSEAHTGFLYSWNVALTEKNAAEEPQVVTGAAREKLITAGDKLVTLFKSNGAWLELDSTNNIAHFAEGRSVFNIDTIWHNDGHLTKLKSMGGEGFGILPTPKYDENQTEYYTGVQDMHNVMTVMYGNKDYEMISAVLELLAYESYNSVRPYYVKNLIRYRTLEDAKSGEMFDIIMEGVTIDYSDLRTGSDPKTRYMLWEKPFMSQLRQKAGSSWPATELAYSNALNEGDVNWINTELLAFDDALRDAG